MFERDGRCYLKRLADVEHWNALCIDLWAYIDADRARRGGKIFVSTRTSSGRRLCRLWPEIFVPDPDI
jgi:hypothetical protein